MIVSVKTLEGPIVGVQSQHVLLVEEVNSGCQITFVNNKRLVVREPYNDLCNKLNTAR